MRNLKRVLSLVLAAMMLIGMMVIGASAADLDKGDVSAEYETAVDVSVALGVIKGSDGQVNPTEPLLRSEAATMITRLLVGPDQAASVAKRFASMTTFKDYDGWSDGYINYCYDQGIIKGAGNKMVEPNGPLLAQEFGLMLLRALGYNDASEGYGSDYPRAVQAGMIKAGIDVVGTEFDEQLTREQAAQMVLQALQADMVDYSTQTEVTTSDGTVVKVLSGRTPVDNSKAESEGINDDDVLQLGEKIDGLALNKDGEDAFKRPGTEWTLDGDEIAFTAKAANKTYNGITGKDAEKLTADDGYTLYYNGVQDYLSNEKDVENGNGLYIDAKTGIIGFEVEVYTADKRVVVREAYLAVVGEAEKDGDDITVTIHRAGQAAGKDVTVEEDDDIYAAVAAYQGKYAAVYADPNTYEILEIAALDKVTATITRRDIGKGKFDSSIVASGKTYGFNNQAVLLSGNGDEAEFTRAGVLSATELGAATLYLYNGYVLLVDRSTNTEKDTPNAGYAYLYDIKEVPNKADKDNKWDSEGGNTTTGTDASTFLARLLLANGTDLTNGVTVALKGNEKAAYEDFEKILGTLVFYTVDSKTGVYTIESIKGTSTGTPNTQVASDNYTEGTGGLEITNKKSEGKVPGESEASNVAFDGKTAFIVVTTSSRVVNGETVKNYKATGNVYDIYNVSNIKAENAVVTAVEDFDAESVEAGAVVTDATKIARVVLIVDAGNKEVSDDIFFIVKDPNAVETKMYKDPTLTGKDLNADDNVIWFYIYNAVVNGKIQKVMVEKTVEFKDEYVLNTNVETETYDGTTVIVGLGEAYKGGFDFTAVSEYKNDHIALTADDSQEDYLVSIAGDKAFTYSTKDGSIKEIKLSDINAKAASETYTKGGVAIRNDAHTVLSALFLDVTK